MATWEEIKKYGLSPAQQSEVLSVDVVQSVLDHANCYKYNQNPAAYMQEMSKLFYTRKLNSTQQSAYAILSRYTRKVFEPDKRM